eukprot:SAG11_NODE_1146_length_5684_cov_59.423277_2_plen_136_part_00
MGREGIDKLKAQYRELYGRQAQGSQANSVALLQSKINEKLKDRVGPRGPRGAIGKTGRKGAKGDTGALGEDGEAFELFIEWCRPPPSRRDITGRRRTGLDRLFAFLSLSCRAPARSRPGFELWVQKRWKYHVETG